MKSYLKFLSRNKLYTAIEAAGLIVSLAFVIIIATSVWDHWRLAHMRPGLENVYLLGPSKMPYMQYKDMKALEAIPEVKRLSGLYPLPGVAQVDGESFHVSLTMADADILEIVGLTLKAGSADLFCTGTGVLISESAARRLFSDKDPLGQMVILSERPGLIGGIPKNETPLPIVGVTANPGNTMLSDFDFLVCFQAQIPVVAQWRESDLRQGMGMMVLPLVELVPDADMEAIEAKYADVAWYMYTTPDPDNGPILTPFSDLYYSSIELEGLRQGKRLYLVVLVILGLILLALAVLNYVNLSLAASSFRAKEMATRRLIGDDRGGIIRRSVLESLLFTFVCFVLAALVAVAVVPALNSLRPPGLAVTFRVSFDVFFHILAMVTILGVGGLAGLIPAAFLASWRPLDVVTGRIRRKRKMGFSRVCIVLQTALALVLVVMTLTLHSQLRHLQTLDVGISPVKDLFYFMPNMNVGLDGLANQLRSSPMVQKIGFANAIPTHPNAVGSGKDCAFYEFYCDTTAFRLLGYRIKEEFEPLRPGLIYLTEEERNHFGTTREEPGDYQLRGQISIGGILEDFRRTPVNVPDRSPASRIGLPGFNEVSVEINDFHKFGLVIQTTGSREVFRAYFRGLVRTWFQEQIGFGDVLTSEEYVFYDYVDNIFARDYDDLSRYSNLVGIFALISILLSMLGLLAMSTYYASTNTKGIAIRKVFGGTVNSEAWRSVLSYMLWVLAAIVIAVPMGVVLARRFLQDYPERISGYWWVFAVAVLLVLAISFASVLWQTLKAARTNPAVELKKE